MRYIEKMKDKKLNERDNFKSKIILHLSDIHFGRNYYSIKGEFSNKDAILEELIECIVSSNYKPDHIIFTGDIAWHGKEKEFDEAYNWFKRLLLALNLSGRNITFCSGNHDVNRNYLNFNRGLTTKAINKIDEIYKYENIFQMETPKENYNKFCGKMGVFPFHYPVKLNFESSYSLGFKDIGDDESGIRIYSFDTSLLSTLPQISEDKMFIGQPQIIDLIESGLFDTNRYKIAIFHHAERFLHPNEICEYDNRKATLPLLREYVDLVLCGHTETGGKPILYKQDEGAATLTSGAAYYDDNHQNSFCFIKLYSDKKIELYPFEWSNCKWKQYDYKKKYMIKSKKSLNVPIAKLEGSGEFSIESETKGNYGIFLNEFAVYNLKNGKVEGNNLDDPNRQIDIKCMTSTLKSGSAKFSFSQPRVQVNNVTATIGYEEFIDYLLGIRQTDSSTVYMKNSVGEVFFSGSNIEMNGEKQDIRYYKDLAQIERAFDIRFIRPDESKEEDIKTVKTLLSYINKGYSEISSLVLCGTFFSDKKKMEKLLHKTLGVNVYLFCKDTFICNLYGAKFEFDGTVVSGPYTFDKKDLQRKIETFMKGDQRIVEFKLMRDGKTYLINKERELKSKMNGKFEYIQIGNMKLKWLNFIEKE